MTTGTSMILIAIGAILKYAITEHAAGINLQNAGVILMLAGAAGLIVELLIFVIRTRNDRMPTDAP